MDEYAKVQLLRTKLKLIAQIRPCQKIDTNTLVILNNNLSTSIRRTFYTIFGRGNSREDLYIMIEDVTDQAYKIIKKHRKSENQIDRDICISLLKDIQDAKVNITNGIRETYLDDARFKAKLEQLYSSIDIKIKSLDNDDIDNSEMLRSNIAM